MDLQKKSVKHKEKNSRNRNYQHPQTAWNSATISGKDDRPWNQPYQHIPQSSFRLSRKPNLEVIVMRVLGDCLFSFFDYARLNDY